MSFVSIEKCTTASNNGDTNLTLYREEIDVIQSIVDLMMSKIFHANTGKFVLYGQKDTNPNPSRILCINRHDKDVETFKKASHFTTDSIMEFFFEDEAELSPSGIYILHAEEAEAKTLVLNCEYGRFLSSVYANFSGDAHAQSTILLLAVAKILTKLCGKDVGLQESWRILKESSNVPIEGYETLIDNLFEKGALPAIVRWNKWTTSEECCPLFFE